MCPRNLIGYPLEPHRMVRTAMGAAEVEPRMVLAATLCCGCGICESLACSQGISPRAVIAGYKVLLGKNGLKYVAREDVSARAEREYRMVKTERWAQSLGVSRFDRIAEYGGKLYDFERVEIPLGRYIGAPGIPVVKDGDRVTVGQLVSREREGLSVPHHASIDGVVTVSDTEIIVERE
jgi:Na+-translocating ferredoxin:NAD+ oxidoreductase RnfC subunit